MAEGRVEPDWVASYYEALEFLYWEPQHIGRQKQRATRIEGLKDVKRHLHRIETTLNYNLRQFFSLAPSSLRNEFFEHVFNRSFAGDFRQYGDEVESEFALKKAMQPDLLFASDGEVVAIEMKVDAKCSVTQVLKYALLGLAVELRTGAPRRHCLALLGSGSFARQWHEGFTTVTELRGALARANSRDFVTTRPTPFREHGGRFDEIVAGLELAYLDYRDLATFLRAARPPETDMTPGDEVYRKLIRGMIGELERRGLT